MTDLPRKTDLSTSERCSLLASDRRRLALDILTGKTAPVELEELAVGIAAREGGSDAVDEETVERVAITLHHVHLPKMVDLGVLDYDPKTNRIDPDGSSILSGQNTRSHD